MEDIHTMQGMHTPRADLDFLYVLEAMLDEGSVSAAAERLALSQPAMSHALARLRQRFGDPLFVKTPSGMRATPMAERLGAAARKVLAIVRAEMMHDGAFDARATSRTFAIGMSDMAAGALLPRISAAFAKSAPSAQLQVVNLKDQDVDSLLEDGKVDVVIGIYRFSRTSLLQQSLFKTTPYVCIARKNHPEIAGKISLTQFAETPHVLSKQSMEAHDYVDRALAAKGLRRRIALEVPYLLPVPGVIASSDYIALVPAALANVFGKIGPLQLLEPPIKPPRHVISQYWHRRFAHEPANKWLRGLLYDVLKE